MQQALILKQNRLMNFILDKWNFAGILGTITAGFSIPSLGIEGGLLAGICGLAMTAVSVYQKYKEVHRDEEKHSLQMKIVEKILTGELPMDKEAISKYLE